MPLGQGRTLRPSLAGIRANHASPAGRGDAQAARLTGLSRRQIVYWSSKGLIGRPGRKTFDGPSIEKIILIKRALEQGTRLQDAARLA